MKDNRIDDGGPAFPQGSPEMCAPGQTVKETQGMTTRDWFAGMALQGQLANAENGSSANNKLARWSYDLADSMLAARKPTTMKDQSVEYNLRDELLKLRTEVDCRTQHGADSNGHLEYVLTRLDTMLANTIEGDQQP